MTDVVEQQIAAVTGRVRSDLIEPLRAVMAEERWGLWCTLYVDSSNASGGALTSPARPAHGWAWGARGRATDSVVHLLGGETSFVRAGLSPEAQAMDSGVAELWGVVHAVRAALEVWPWLAGVGVRCDNQEAVRAVRGCDGRDGGARIWSGTRRKLRPAQESLLALVSPLGVHLRAVHVHGHHRAAESAQRAMNQSADSLARQAARGANRGVF